MNKKQIEQEFRKINDEFRGNRPHFVPYPQDIVRRRELLLFAQVHLNNIWDSKLKKDEWSEIFETEMYHKVMELYYNWDRE